MNIAKQINMIKADWQKDVPEDFSDASRVWIYQSSRPFSGEEQQMISRQLEDFTGSWMSHNRPVKGWAAVFFNQFILLMADDTMDRLCGSAVDHSVRFMKELESQYDLELINRMNMGFIKADALLVIPMEKVSRRIAGGEITGETLFFNNAITTKRQLLDDWIRPFKESFLWEKVAKETPIV